jgi:ubiquinone/menaquinone biosynthesis C-methylase UbiE/uncharacterized protein YbaR (Trm112 family)
MLAIDEVAALACPACRAGLRYHGPRGRQTLERGALACDGCGAEWPIVDGLPRLYRESEVRGTDRLMRFLYDGMAGYHDLAVRWLLPVLQLGGTEHALRDAYMKRLELASLRPRPDGRPLRILEVGVGPGANIALVKRDLPPGLDVELWGLDLSLGMIEEGRRRYRDEVRFLMADAHALPFRDGWFDRVFHVGGISGFRDVRRALAEMARVAAPGTPIVVVDEQLDRRYRFSPYHQLTFFSITFYDPGSKCPTALLPAGAEAVLEEQLSRFYYGLTFRMPQPASGRTPQ